MPSSQTTSIAPSDPRLRLAAILAAEPDTYSSSESVDAQAAIEALDRARETFQTTSIAHGGSVVGMAGDSVLAIFETAGGALAAALAAQYVLEKHASAIASKCRLRYRIGLHLGDVVQEADGFVHGDDVNVAIALQATAPTGGIVVSESIRLVVCGSVNATFEHMEDCSLTNVGEPVRAHRVIGS